jgi:hypothetical protein
MKKLQLRKVYVFFSSVLIFMLHLPFTFAKSRAAEVKAVLNSGKAVTLNLGNSASMIYDSLKLNFLGLSKQAYNYALQGMEKLKQSGRIYNDQLISIVDFTRPSTEKRLFVIDLKNKKLLFNTYVAHGQKSGKEFATNFSNTPESYQSSLGFYETSETYIGKNGYSMRLIGLENGINDKADERAIVMHGAPYVSENFVKAQGYLGRSWGCPAVPEQYTRPIIDKIKNGSCLFIYSEKDNYISHSRILNS